MFLLQILLIVGCLMISSGDTIYYDAWTRDMAIVAVAGFCLIISAFIIVYVFDDTHELFEKIFLCTGAVLNLIVGILNLVDYIRGCSRTTDSLILLIVCLAAGSLMLVDFILTMKG